jgi:hypothetical protein
MRQFFYPLIVFVANLGLCRNKRSRKAFIFLPIAKNRHNFAASNKKRILSTKKEYYQQKKQRIWKQRNFSANLASLIVLSDVFFAKHSTTTKPTIWKSITTPSVVIPM